MWTSSSFYNVNDSGLCERLVHFTMCMIHADLNVKITSHSVNDSGWCEPLAHFTMWMIQADMNI
jgi:hypothetical protein